MKAMETVLHTFALSEIIYLDKKKTEILIVQHRDSCVNNTAVIYYVQLECA